jgi:catechol 2,3-dioxygenase-like lactoylglutathione lyase family enzyme
MLSYKTHIHLDVDDALRSAAFYEALLGAPPARRSASEAVFESDSPPLVLTLENRPPARPAKRRLANGVDPPRRDKGGLPRSTARSGFALLVTEPSHVGTTAIALRRAGVPLRIYDQGLEAKDPDGIAWRVRFEPSAAGRAVIATRETRERSDGDERG